MVCYCSRNKQLDKGLEAMKHKTNRTYHFEVYTCHPQTGETGWDIEHGFIHDVRNRDDAVLKVGRYFDEQYDCAIQVYEVSNDLDLNLMCLYLNLSGMEIK